MRVIAHRGASAYAPENTLIAFKKAFEMGVCEVEFDVQMTKDGQLVVIHDFFLERTTNGKGLIMETNYEDIYRLDAGNWFGEAFSGEKVPLLSDVIDVCLAENALRNPDTQLIMHIEIKKPKREKRPVELSVLELVNKKHCMEQIIISSFSHRCLKHILKQQKVKVGVLISEDMIGLINYLKKHGLLSYSINQSAEFIDQKLVTKAHKAGIQVLSYTVNDPHVARYFDSLGVDAIFSNYPDII
jgi:glycerophosphoryl diester phosphodiesterase